MLPSTLAHKVALPAHIRSVQSTNDTEQLLQALSRSASVTLLLMFFPAFIAVNAERLWSIYTGKRLGVHFDYHHDRLCSWCNPQGT